jgi:hypothetical protein
MLGIASMAQQSANAESIAYVGSLQAFLTFISSDSCSSGWQVISSNSHAVAAGM